MVRINFHDLLRATLPAQSGNEGWIGVSPKADRYHVVVPVDAQIARGVMACNRPTDGTPFGGYSGWLYFRCPQYDLDQGPSGDEIRLRTETAGNSARQLIRWLASYGIEAQIDCAAGLPGAGSAYSGHEESSAHEASPGGARAGSRERGVYCCDGCGKMWNTLGQFLRDPDVRFDRYRLCLDDFRRGAYVFSHACGASVEVSVSRLARPRFSGKSLAGSHACPNLCYYEASMASCSAMCEGAIYRRLARKLKRC